MINNNLLEKWQDLAAVYIPPLESTGFTENVLHREIWEQPKKAEEPQKLSQEPVLKEEPPKRSEQPVLKLDSDLNAADIEPDSQEKVKETDLDETVRELSPEPASIPKPQAALDMTEEIKEPQFQEFSASEDETTLLTLPEELDEDQTVLLCAEEPENIPEPEERAYIIRTNTNERIDVNKEPFILGKSEKADYQIHGNNTISRKHVEISKTEDGYALKDLNSSNHTYLDGKKVTKPEPLEDGQTFKLSDEEFCFFIETV